MLRTQIVMVSTKQKVKKNFPLRSFATIQKYKRLGIVAVKRETFPSTSRPYMKSMDRFTPNHMHKNGISEQML